MLWGFRAVSLREEGEKVWTSDNMKASSVNLKPLSELVGKTVTKSGCTGTVVDFLSDRSEYIPGPYLVSSKRYSLRKKLEMYNSQVGVFWTKINPKGGMPPYWNNFNTLKFD